MLIANEVIMGPISFPSEIRNYFLQNNDGKNDENQLTKIFKENFSVKENYIAWARQHDSVVYNTPRLFTALTIANAIDNIDEGSAITKNVNELFFLIKPGINRNTKDSAYLSVIDHPEKLKNNYQANRLIEDHPEEYFDAVVQLAEAGILNGKQLRKALLVKNPYNDNFILGQTNAFKSARPALFSLDYDELMDLLLTENLYGKSVLDCMSSKEDTKSIKEFMGLLSQINEKDTSLDSELKQIRIVFKTFITHPEQFKNDKQAYKLIAEHQKEYFDAIFELSEAGILDRKQVMEALLVKNPDNDNFVLSKRKALKAASPLLLAMDPGALKDFLLVKNQNGKSVFDCICSKADSCDPLTFMNLLAHLNKQHCIPHNKELKDVAINCFFKVCDRQLLSYDEIFDLSTILINGNMLMQVICFGAPYINQIDTSSAPIHLTQMNLTELSRYHNSKGKACPILKKKLFINQLALSKVEQINFCGSVKLHNRKCYNFQTFPLKSEDKVFYEFLMKNIKNKDFTLEFALNILLEMKDLEGFKLLLSKKRNQKPLNAKLLSFVKIREAGPDFIDALFESIPAKQLIDFVNYAQINWDIETQSFLISKNVPFSKKQMENYVGQKEWFEKNAEGQIPALKHYNAYRQILTYKGWYLNNDKDQNFYRQEISKSVKFALFIMNEIKNSDDNSNKFESLLTSLGSRRNSIAIQTKTLKAESFGKKREKFHRIFLDNYDKEYSRRLEKLILKGETSASIEINKKKYDLAEYKIQYFEAAKETKSYTFHDCPFWVPNHPVFKHVSNLFEEIVKMEDHDLDPQDIKNKIAEFHWLMANTMPFDRGTASIAEVLTDALWLLHGFIPPLTVKQEEGKSMDLDAILSPKVEEFQKNYPSGVPYLKVDKLDQYLA